MRLPLLTLFALACALLTPSSPAVADEHAVVEASAADGISVDNVEAVPLGGRRPVGGFGGKKAPPPKPKTAAPGKATGGKAANPPGKAASARGAAGKKKPGASGKTAPGKSKPSTQTAKRGTAGKLPPHLPRHIHKGAQGKHIVGHNNFQAQKSPLKRDANAQKMLDGVHSGQYKIVGRTRSGRAHPIVDFKRPIGTVNGKPTNYAAMHVSQAKGVHFVPHIGGMNPP